MLKNCIKSGGMAWGPEFKSKYRQKLRELYREKIITVIHIQVKTLMIEFSSSRIAFTLTHCLIIKRPISQIINI
jgi:hypothetical protein